MAKNERLDRTESTQAVRTPKVFAGPCPRNPAHPQTRVYKTDGRVRRCICDDCGKTWKQIGPEAGSDDEEKTVVDAES